MDEYEFQDRVLRPRQQAEFLGISLSTLYEIAARDPGFPPNIHLGGRARGRLLSDLVKYVKDKQQTTTLPLGDSDCLDETNEAAAPGAAIEQGQPGPALSSAPGRASPQEWRQRHRKLMDKGEGR